jgi:hypothetical protein
MFADFLKLFVITTAIAWILLAFPLYWLGDPMVVWGTLVGWALPTLCFVAGFYTIYRTFHLPLQKLMIAFFGGMVVRLLFIGTVLVIILKLTQLPLISVIASLFGFYVLYLILELYFVNSRLHQVEGSKR